MLVSSILIAINYTVLMSVKTKSIICITFQLKPRHKWTVWTFEQSLYIVVTNVNCASCFVCLLVELQIIARITNRVTKSVQKRIFLQSASVETILFQWWLNTY